MIIDLTPEHTTRWQGADKDLHPEVIAAYRYVESVLDFADVPSSKLGAPLWSGWALREAFLAGCSHAARTALSHPEPEGPTDEELLAIAAASIDGYQGSGIAVGEYEAEYECAVEAYGSELITFARAVLARWSRPAIEPPAKPAHNTAQHSSQRP